MARTVYRSVGMATAGAAVLCCAARAAAHDRYGEFLEEGSVMAPNAQETTAIPHRNGIATNVVSPSAVRVDEVYVSKVSGKGFTIFYMEHAETVRGPRGALLDRNVTKDLVQYVPVKPGDGRAGYGTAISDRDQVREGIADVLNCDYLVLLGGPPCAPPAANDSHLGIDNPLFEWPLTGFGSDLTMQGSVEDRTEQLLSLVNTSTLDEDGHTPCPTSPTDQRQEAVR